MHPLLTRPRQLGLYLLVWVPLAGILAYLLTGRDALNWTAAISLTAPLCFAYAFACLSAWYPCRATPLEQSGFLKLVLTHLIAAALLSTLWLQLAKAIAIVLAHHAGFGGLDERLARFNSLLWVCGFLLYMLSVTLHYVLLAEQASREAEQRALEARVLARDAELKALRAQVNPHFLFNCLHSISALTSVDAGRAREMCILLAEFLRVTLRLGGKEAITLQEELALVRGYLAIEKVRFGQRISMEEDVANDTMDLLIPPLLLQPLIENSIRHGIANLPEGGTIRLSIRREDRHISISVENNFDPDTPSSLKTGLGLGNIRQRLNTRYGNEADVSVSTESDHFIVRLELPAQRNGAGV